jgi:hypothetical protein
MARKQSFSVIVQWRVSLKAPTLKFSENWVLVIVSSVGACVFRTPSPQPWKPTFVFDVVITSILHMIMRSKIQITVTFKAKSLLW